MYVYQKLIDELTKNIFDIDIDIDSSRYLSANPAAIEYLKKYPSIINLCQLCHNTNKTAIDIINDNLDKLTPNCWENLCLNPNAIDIINDNLDKLTPKCWENLSENPNAIPILEKNMNFINWTSICSNPNAIHIIEQNFKKLTKTSWNELSANPNAIHILKKKTKKINLIKLCKNPNPDAISLIEKYINESNINSMHSLFSNQYAIHLIENIIENNFKKLSGLHWTNLCRNPNAIHIIEMHLDMLNIYCWDTLSSNPKAISLLKKYQDNISWSDLCQNPNPDAFYLIENNIDKLDERCWHNLKENPIVFENYQKKSIERTNLIYDDLICKALQPSRVSKWLDYFLEQGNDISDFDWICN